MLPIRFQEGGDKIFGLVFFKRVICFHDWFILFFYPPSFKINLGFLGVDQLGLPKLSFNVGYFLEVF